MAQGEMHVTVINKLCSHGTCHISLTILLHVKYFYIQITPVLIFLNGFINSPFHQSVYFGVEIDIAIKLCKINSTIF
jgi:hypothetical protein